MQRPVRHPDPLAGQQLLDLHDSQRIQAGVLVAFDPRGDLLLVAQQQLPGGAVPVRPRGPDRLDHRTDELIGDRLRPGVAGQASGLGSGDVTAGGLAVHPRPLSDLPHPVPLQPRPQHLTDLDHADLPEPHR